MTFRILFETRAKKEFLKLSRDTQEQLSHVLEDLAQNPRPLGAKKLTGQAGYRVRKGAYRILYIVNDPAKEVVIYRIGHRREIYR